MKVTDEDRQMIKVLQLVLNKGSFSLEWREAIAFGKAKIWMDGLEKRFNQNDKEITITEEPDADQ